MIFLTADLHFFHSNVIKYCNRPFITIEEMNETIIKNWNYKVKADDEVYLLGDVAFCGDNKAKELLDRLNGRIYLIEGNHDRGKLKTITRFEWRKYYHELKVDGTTFVLFHYPIEFWNKRHRGSIHLHGHSHGGLGKNLKTKRIDVGIDCWNYFPVSLEEIKEELKKYSEPSNDHHGKDL